MPEEGGAGRGRRAALYYFFCDFCGELWQFRCVCVRASY
jgi:hypothetical protein